jgi:hypothetical protein
VVVRGLIEKGLIRPRTAGGSRLIELVKRVLLDDQAAEIELEKEVEAILQKNSELLDREGADWGKMFHKIKAKLAQEKGMVL